MRTTPQADKDRENILSIVKRQYEPGAIRRRLYELFEEHGRKLAEPVYNWMSYGGMGDFNLDEVSANESLATAELLQSGRLVATFEENFYGVKKIREIKHFDDVNFRLDENGGIVIYELVKWLPEPDRPDLIVRPDEKFDAAVIQLRKRLEDYKALETAIVDESPIQLKGGPVIKPIITDKPCSDNATSTRISAINKNPAGWWGFYLSEQHKEILT